MYELMKELFPICRSITGNGVRESLGILARHIPIEISEVPTGTKAFDWTVPDEWNVRDACVLNEAGERVIDFKRSNLHLVNYSEPFEGSLTRDELDEHLYSLPDQPELIPYVTSYYKRRWGFCLAHRDRVALPEGTYRVRIDTTLEPGSLTYAELVIPGESREEVLVSTYLCHPSMANNELSGPVVATFLAKHLLGRQVPAHYTYRFVFAPETIGSLTYLSRNLDHLRQNVVAGYVVTCIGDPGKFSYLQTRAEGALSDRAALHVLGHATDSFSLYSFLDRGSDERQYNAPGIDLPIGSLMRTKYATYPEYHTSGDDLSFVTPEALEESLGMYQRVIETLDNNRTYRATVLGEPQLGQRGLYPTLSTSGSGLSVRTMSNLLAYADGTRDLISIADKLGCPVWELQSTVDTLLEHKLIEPVAQTQM